MVGIKFIVFGWSVVMHTYYTTNRCHWTRHAYNPRI